jgi:hypothetical protein
MGTPLKNLSVALGVVIAVSACGRKSSSDDGGGGGSVFSSNMQNLTGTVTSQSGTPAQMKGWAVAMIERDSRVARVADADASGILRWSKVSFDAAQTAVLLSPDYLLQAVMAIPSTKVNTVKQFFTIGSTSLPQLVQKGSGLSFQSTTGVTIYDYYATDSDSDGNPDGVGSLGLTLGSVGLTSVDTDKDGLVNESDGDIDGDGIANALDGDDDGDGNLDIFDTDANGNSIADSQETNNDAYYSQGIEYFSVRYEQGVSANSMLFVVKARSGLSPAPTAVTIKAPSSLTDGATSIATDASTASWDMSLADDGKSYDGAATDLVYGRKVQLASGKAPRANQVLFARVTFGTGDSAFTIEYPWVFPNVSLSAITTSYNTSTRVVTLAGNPFGADTQTFVWSVSLTNAAGLKVYESTAISGDTRTLTIPSNVMESGGTYTYEAVAQSLDKVPGIPTVAVRSSAGSISN